MAGVPGNQASFALGKQTQGKGGLISAYTDRLPFSGGSIGPSRQVDNLSETDSNRDQGVAFLQSYGVEGSPEVYVRDANMHHILEAALGSIADAGAGPYTHTITPASTLPYYSMYRELGTVLYEQFGDCKVSQLTISADAGQPLKAAMTVQGRDAQRLLAAPANTNEVKSVTTTGTPSGGTFRLGYDNVWTAAIPYNETAANIATALNGLANITAFGGTFTGSGGPLPTAVTLTAATGFVNRALLPIQVDYSGLTGGSSPTAAVTTTTQGAAVLPAIASTAVYNFNEAIVTLAGNITASVGSFELTINNNLSTQQTDDAKLYDVVEGLREVTLGFKLIFADAQEYSRFHYGGTSGIDQSQALATTTANFKFVKAVGNQVQFDLPSIAYTEFPVEPNPGGDPVEVDVRAVALRGGSPVVTATVVNSVAT